MFYIKLISVFVLLLLCLSLIYVANKDHEKGDSYNKKQVIYIILGIFCLIAALVLSILFMVTTVSGFLKG